MKSESQVDAAHHVLKWWIKHSIGKGTMRENVIACVVTSTLDANTRPRSRVRYEFTLCTSFTCGRIVQLDEITTYTSDRKCLIMDCGTLAAVCSLQPLFYRSPCGSRYLAQYLWLVTIYVMLELWNMYQQIQFNVNNVLNVRFIVQ